MILITHSLRALDVMSLYILPGDWKRGIWKLGTVKNAGVENAGVHGNVAPEFRVVDCFDDQIQLESDLKELEQRARATDWVMQFNPQVLCLSFVN